MFGKSHQLFIKGDKNATDWSRRPTRSASVYVDPDESQTGPVGINAAKHRCWRAGFVFSEGPGKFCVFWILISGRRSRAALPPRSSRYQTPFTPASRHPRQLSDDLLESFPKLTIMDICFSPSYSWGKWWGEASSFDLRHLRSPIWHRSWAVVLADLSPLLIGQNHHDRFGRGHLR